MLLVGGTENREAGRDRRLEVAGVDFVDLIGMVGRERIEVGDDLGLERRIVDGRALGGGVEDDDIALGVAAERLVDEITGGGRLRRRVVEAALTQVVWEVPAVGGQDC